VTAAAVVETTEAQLRAQIDAVKAQRSSTPRQSDAWAALGVEVGRITAQVWKLRRDERWAAAARFRGGASFV
jgi:uncharacterized small protein (DUF1192 family)